MSKFDPARFLIFVLVFVSCDFEVSANVSCEESTVSPRTGLIFSPKVPFQKKLRKKPREKQLTRFIWKTTVEMTVMVAVIIGFVMAHCV